MTADNPTPVPNPPRKTAARLRTIGVVVLLLGLGGAGLVYWTGTAPDDLSADPATARDYKLAARNTEINFGKVSVLTADLQEDLKHPGTQAGLILVATIIAASGCFYVAGLLARRDKLNDLPQMLPPGTKGKVAIAAEVKNAN